MDAERAHRWVGTWLKALGSVPPLVRWLRSRTTLVDPRLSVRLWDLTFPNPVGLAAGFDKGCEWVAGLPALGFGFLEVGTITPLPHGGNPSPRLFRAVKDEALINRLGFNNPGAKVARERLRRFTQRLIPIGVNIGKTPTTPQEDAISDYLNALEALFHYADYLVLNVSSPNTQGLRQFEAPSRLEELLSAVCERHRQLAGRAGGHRPPLLVKISPDLSPEQLEQVTEAALRHHLGGIIATNTTVSREGLRTLVTQEGGVSGLPLVARSTAVIQRIFRQVKGRLAVIGVGGIFSAEDAYAKIRAGASLIQIYTGLVYRGPGLVKRVNAGLLALCQRDGFSSVQAAVGTGGG
ncbi:MAG: quinone-dependent dihydroorotate dehydrogenase [Elusimicrobia bacterium]|nr:quinone-dependent dihydroorotate dehydrogenase [Elusimicrobiota bacterium]